MKSRSTIHRVLGFLVVARGEMRTDFRNSAFELTFATSMYREPSHMDALPIAIYLAVWQVRMRSEAHD
ncbi:MAG: hypothetical protein O3A13_09010 [Proteobacteria bacterium]|nr:hypothetical protein [Pseudomonadota bacterium]MDA0993759.1 hypothetical protein [Pseudomonadota bacterium]